MNRIPELKDITVSLDEAIELNNTVPSPFAYVFNKWKNTPEFELVPVEKIESDNGAANIRVVTKEGKWEIWQTEVFVSVEQIESLIKLEQFFFAPIRLTGEESYVKIKKGGLI